MHGEDGSECYVKQDSYTDGYYPKVGVSIFLAKSGLSGVRMFQELLKSILDLELIGRREPSSKEPVLTIRGYETS